MNVFVFFFEFDPTYTSNECFAWSPVLAIYICLPLILALMLCTLGSIAAPHHRFMLACIANAHAPDICPETNMLLKRRIFFIPFFFDFFLSFLFYFNFLLVSNCCSSVIQCMIFFPLCSVAYSFISKTIYDDDCCFIYMQYCSGSGSGRNRMDSFFLSFFPSISVLLSLFHLIIPQ